MGRMQRQGLFFVALPALGPEPCKPETAVKEEENREDDFHFPGKVLETGARQHIDPQGKIEEDDKPGEIFGKFPHGIYG